MSLRAQRGNPSRIGLWGLCVILLLLLPELALLGFFTIGALLSSPAELPHRADAVVVLGGGDESRYERGRELVLAGYADRMVFIEPNTADRQDALARLPLVEIWEKVHPQNSWGEAQTVRAWMRAKGWKSVLVVSDPPHLLRVRYAWASNFRSTDLTYTLIASTPPWWSSWRWWQNPRSAQFVEAEMLRLGYYVLRYPLGFCIGGVCD